MRRFSRSVIAHGLARTGADQWLARASGKANDPLILGYHRVHADADPTRTRGVPSLGIRASTLERHLEFVSRRFKFVSLDEMGARIKEGTAQGRAAVTFDDGYADFAENAFPVLQRMGVPAAVFVVTRLLDRSSGFLHDRVYSALERSLRSASVERVTAVLAEGGLRVSELPGHAFAATRLLLRSHTQEALLKVCEALELEFGLEGGAPRSLSWEEVIRMSRAGLIIGSHTRTHTLLPRERPERVIEETLTSRTELEARLGKEVAHFVYPDGAFDAATVRAVAAAGYLFGYTGCRHQDPDHPLLTLPRRVLWEGSTRGALGQFSPDVLSAQICGVFDRSNRCTETHQAARPRALGTVAMVAPSLDVPGGQSIQAAAVAKGLRDEGFEVIAVATNPRFPKSLAWLRRVPLARTLLNQVMYAWSLRHLRRADAVHVFSASFWSFLLAPVPAMLAARAFGKRVILNYHSGEAGEHLGRWSALVHPGLRLAHRIVVPSLYLREVFARHGYEAEVIRNVVDTRHFRYRERLPLRPRLLSTRTLEPSYGVDVVVRAFALLLAACPDASLVIAGAGSEEDRLRRLSEGLSGVSFVGRVRPERVPELCADADIFVNASVVDNQPLSLLEAFASGLPVVTTATGDIAAMVRHGESGMVVPPGDPAAMFRSIEALLSDPALSLRVTRGARAVALRHSWEQVRDPWIESYAGDSPLATSLEPHLLPEERRC
jgi:glycosyltransferase involved in cell wall biosynthesis/peptidoglycan/xylan/chitin deacetylase (PgdA/CDA1 family)